MPETFSSRLRSLRSARGWSQRDLAARAGVRQPTIHDIETGTSPRLCTLLKLAKAFGLTGPELIEGVDLDDGT